MGALRERIRTTENHGAKHTGYGIGPTVRKESEVPRGWSLCRDRAIVEAPEARFLVVGGGNTASGYTVSSLVYYLLHAFTPLLAIIAICTVINVTVSYVTQKFLVFRTRGNTVAEYLRFYVVSGVSIVLSFVLLPIAIDGLKMNPYLSMAIVTGITTGVSYFGHKHVSFRVGQGG